MKSLQLRIPEHLLTLILVIISNNAECHIELNEDSDEESYGSCGLLDWVNGVDNCMRESGPSEHFEQESSRGDGGIGEDVEQTDDQERNNVLQIIQMSPVRNYQGNDYFN